MGFSKNFKVEFIYLFITFMLKFQLSLFLFGHLNFVTKDGIVGPDTIFIIPFGLVVSSNPEKDDLQLFDW